MDPSSPDIKKPETEDRSGLEDCFTDLFRTIDAREVLEELKFYPVKGP
jgi:hypothetical protein